MKLQEQCYQMTMLASYILADDPTSETPPVPAQFNHCRAVDSVNALFDALMKIAEGERALMERVGPSSPHVSPRVGVAIVDALERIAPTYLVPSGAEQTTYVTALLRRDLGGNRSLALNVAAQNIVHRSVEPQLAVRLNTCCSSPLLPVMISLPLAPSLVRVCSPFFRVHLSRCSFLSPPTFSFFISSPSSMRSSDPRVC